MQSHECTHCLNNRQIIEDKDKKLAIYQSNLLELKSQIAESNNLISAYFAYKNENEVLKKEIDSLRKASYGKDGGANISYEVEILRNKYLREVEKNKNLQISYDQTCALLEEYNDNKNSKGKSEVNKLKREISEKEKHINSQNLTIEKLKEQIKGNCTNVNTKETFTFQKDDIMKYEIAPEHMDDVQNFSRVNNLNYEGHQNNQIQLKQLYEENEFLKKKYQKYQNKYIKFKYKYKQTKMCIKLFLESQAPLRQVTMNTSIINEDDKQILGNKTKRKLTNEQNFEEGDIFENMNKDIPDISIDHIESGKEESSEQVKEKELCKKITKDKKGKQNPQKKRKKIEKKAKDIKKEVEISKKKSKLKKANQEKQHNTNNEILSEKENAIQAEIPQNNIKSFLTNHINPLRKPARQVTVKKREEFIMKFLQLMHSETFSSQVIATSLEDLFKNFKTLNDQVTYLLEGIFTNISSISLSRILLFIEIFITKNDTKIAVTNFLEFILHHYSQIITNTEDKLVIGTLEIENEFHSKSILSHEIIEKYSSVQYIISYILALFFHNKVSIPEISNFIIEFAEKNNSTVNKILFLLKFLTKNVVVTDENFINDLAWENYRKNFNKIYFLSKFRNKIVSRGVFEFIFSLWDESVDIWSESIQKYIVAEIKNRIHLLSDDIAIREMYNEKINFSYDLVYLEIFQMLGLISKCTSIEYICEKIFVDVLWDEFIQSKEDSSKRCALVYYSSYIFYLCVQQDKTLEKEFTVKILSWLGGIYDSKFESNKISLYDKICALSWLIDAHIVRQHPETIQRVLKTLFQSSHSDNFPDDFIEKVKKNNLVINMN